jgi:hypothetical protein
MIWDGMSWLWFWFDTFLLEEVCKVRPIITGDTMEPGEVALVIVNHRYRCPALNEQDAPGLAVHVAFFCSTRSLHQ